MNSEEPSIIRYGFCIYIDTLCQGAIPTVSDENGYIVFETELEARKEIVDNMMTRRRKFLDGERNYEDAITDADGNCFSPRPE